MIEDSPPAPKGWDRRMGPAGDEIRFRPIRARGFSIALAFNLLLMGFFGYQIWGFLENWFIDKAEVLPAGVILFLIMCGGGLFVFRNFRLLFRTVRYIMGPSSFQIRESRLGSLAISRDIEKSRIRKVIRTYTPPRADERNPTWGTLIECSFANGPDARVPLEGYGEEESEFLSRAIAAWAAVRSEVENTSA